MSLPSSPSAYMNKSKRSLKIHQINNTPVFSITSPKSQLNYKETSSIQQQKMFKDIEQTAQKVIKQNKKLKSALQLIQENNLPDSQKSNLCNINKLATNKHKRSQTFDFATQPTENRSNNGSLSRIQSEDSLKSNDASRDINAIYKSLEEGIDRQSKELKELKQITQQQAVKISKLKQKNIVVCQELASQKQANIHLLSQLRQQQQKRIVLQSKLRQIQKILFNPSIPQ